jgi:hypothetical protein
MPIRAAIVSLPLASLITGCSQSAQSQICTWQATMSTRVQQLTDSELWIGGVTGLVNDTQ